VGEEPDLMEGEGVWELGWVAEGAKDVEAVGMEEREGLRVEEGTGVWKEEGESVRLTPPLELPTKVTNGEGVGRLREGVGGAEGVLAASRETDGLGEGVEKGGE
jgi:hypothetical protein